METKLRSGEARITLLDEAEAYADSIGAGKPEGLVWFLKAVGYDLRTYGDYLWPHPGSWAACDEEKILTGNRGPCPLQPGDGLCVAKTWRGMASGGTPAITGLLVGVDPKDFLGSDSEKLRARRVYVRAILNMPRLLRDANLHRADLKGANLYSADLGGANLKGANLYRADLYSANLKGANLHRADLKGANLHRADLYGANLKGANLYSADLGGANLKGAYLYGAYLYSADLYGADLKGADLGDADLRDANLKGADLKGAYLYGANLGDADLGDANLRDADLRDADLRDANLRDADLRDANANDMTIWPAGYDPAAAKNRDL